MDEMRDQPVVPSAYCAAALTPTMIACWLGLRGKSPRAKDGATLHAACKMPTRTAGSVVNLLSVSPIFFRAAAMNLAMRAIMPVIEGPDTLPR